MDLLSLLLSIASGAANGTFPIFIKTPRVLAANVHPVVSRARADFDGSRRRRGVTSAQ